MTEQENGKASASTEANPQEPVCDETLSSIGAEGDAGFLRAAASGKVRPRPENSGLEYRDDHEQYVRLLDRKIRELGGRATPFSRAFPMVGRAVMRMTSRAVER